MPNIKLSFCIPTYNRANFIGQTLTSIADQIIECAWTACIEICLCDNASTDNTDEVIRRFRVNYPSVKLIYTKNSENLGADRNYLRVVELATGEYCWLMGSDDAITLGAIEYLFDSLKSGEQILLGNRIICDYQLNRIRDDKWLTLHEKSDISFDFSKRDNLIRYLTSGVNLGSVFSYLSSIIFLRELWQPDKNEEKFVGSAYVHAFKLLSLVKAGCRLKYLQRPIVYSRSGNDSFASAGGVNRIMLDLRGYKMISDELFSSDQQIKKLLLKCLRRNRPLFRSAAYIRRRVSDMQWEAICTEMVNIGYSRLALDIFGRSIIPVNVLYSIKAQLNRMIRSIRST